MEAGRDNTPLRILILGGSGVFGSRIARLLAAEPNIEVIVAGRHFERAERVVQDIARRVPVARISARSIDRDNHLAETLSTAGVNLVIHAAGPFQGQDYDVPRAALAAGAHYLDLADDRGFVEQFHRLDSLAKSKNRLALTGLSSVPALSSSVVAALAKGLTQIAEIRIGITPGNRAPRGHAVVAGILAGVGQPSEQRKGGDWRAVRGWQDLHRRSLKVGNKRLRRWFAHCEVPDPDCLLARYPTAETITFHAGLELTVEHLGLWLLSFLVASGIIKNLAHFAQPLEWADTLFRGFGSDRGGMFVEVIGRDRQHKWVRRSWTLIAGAGDGPMVPAIPSALMAKEIAQGRAPAPGARTALECLPIAAIEEAFASFDINTERVEEPLELALYVRLLGTRFGDLPPAIRDVHMGLVTLRFEGETRVTRGTNALSGLAGRLFSLPVATETARVTVTIEPRDGGERWTRTFGARRFRTDFSLTRHKTGSFLTERFGPFRFEMIVDAGTRKLRLSSVKATCFGLPWPDFLAPRIRAEERVENARFVFDVRVELPLLGLLVHYIGWLVPLSVSLRPKAMRRPEVSPVIESPSPTWPN